MKRHGQVPQPGRESIQPGRRQSRRRRLSGPPGSAAARLRRRAGKDAAAVCTGRPRLVSSSTARPEGVRLVGTPGPSFSQLPRGRLPWQTQARWDMRRASKPRPSEVLGRGTATTAQGSRGLERASDTHPSSFRAAQRRPKRAVVSRFHGRVCDTAKESRLASRCMQEADEQCTVGVGQELSSVTTKPRGRRVRGVGSPCPSRRI